MSHERHPSPGSGGARATLTPLRGGRAKDGRAAAFLSRAGSQGGRTPFTAASSRPRPAAQRRQAWGPRSPRPRPERPAGHKMATRAWRAGDEEGAWSSRGAPRPVPAPLCLSVRSDGENARAGPLWPQRRGDPRRWPSSHTPAPAPPGPGSSQGAGTRPPSPRGQRRVPRAPSPVPRPRSASGNERGPRRRSHSLLRTTRGAVSSGHSVLHGARSLTPANKVRSGQQRGSHLPAPAGQGP